jgi:hypothetical protein
MTLPTAPVDGTLYPPSPATGQIQYRYNAKTKLWESIAPAQTVIPGTYGSSSEIPKISIDSSGAIYAAESVPFQNNVDNSFVPTSSSDPGELGQMSFDAEYLYWYDGSRWNRVKKDDW